MPDGNPEQPSVHTAAQNKVGRFARFEGVIVSREWVQTSQGKRSYRAMT
jgi:hypothetical protein